MSSEQTAGGPVLIDPSAIPAVIPVIPLRNSVFFPGGVLPLAVGRSKTIALVKDAVRDDLLIAIVTQRRVEDEDPAPDALYQTGTLARIVKLQKMGEDNYSLVVQGFARLRVLEFVSQTPYLQARVKHVPEPRGVAAVEVEALGIELKKVAIELLQLMPELPAAATELVESITDPGQLADLLAANLDIPIEEKQSVLNSENLLQRMRLVLGLMNLKREIVARMRQADE